MTNTSQKKAESTVGFDFQAVFQLDDYLHFYTQTLLGARTEAEVNFLRNVLDLSSPRNILDAACGFGRHSNRLAEEGHKVVGTDLSLGFLAYARRKAQEDQCAPQYVCQDLRTLSFRETFDAALLLSTAFGYFSEQENLIVLRSLSASLTEGGLVCLDVINRDVQLKSPCRHFVTEFGDDLMIDRLYFDGLTGRLENQRILIRDGKRRDTPFSLRTYSLQELEALLREASLRPVEIYGNWDGSAFDTHSGLIIAVAERIP